MFGQGHDTGGSCCRSALLGPRHLGRLVVLRQTVEVRVKLLHTFLVRDLCLRLDSIRVLQAHNCQNFVKRLNNIFYFFIKRLKCVLVVVEIILQTSEYEIYV